MTAASELREEDVLDWRENQARAASEAALADALLLAACAGLSSAAAASLWLVRN